MLSTFCTKANPRRSSHAFSAYIALPSTIGSARSNNLAASPPNHDPDVNRA